MKDNIKHIGVLIFVALMFSKISAMHVYVHDSTGIDTVEHCELCIVAIESQQSEILPTTIAAGHTAQVTDSKAPKATSRDLSIPRNTLDFDNFSRPPPSPFH